MKSCFLVFLIVYSHSLSLLCAESEGNQTTPEKDQVTFKTNWALHFEGRHIYQKLCVQCHGKLGKGDGPWSKDLRTNPPRDFHAAIYKLRSTPRGKLPTDEDLRRSISQGVSGTAMPSFSNTFQEHEYAAVIEYIKCFSKKWRDPSHYAPAIPIPQPPAWLTAPKAHPKIHAEQKTKGQEIYIQHCASCHGDKGEGDGPAAKDLKDSVGYPSHAANLTHPIKSGKTHQDLYRAIATGLDGTPMLGYAEILSPLEIWQIASWIESIRIEFK